MTSSFAMTDLDWTCGFQQNADHCLESITVIPFEKAPDNNSSESSTSLDDELLSSSDFGVDSSASEDSENLTIPMLGSSSQQRPRLNSNLLTIAAAAGALVLIFPNDQAISDFVQDNSNSVTEAAAFAGELIGSELPIAAAGVGYIVGLVMKDNKIKKTSILLAKSLLITGLLAQGLKRVFHRERPSSSGNGPYEFHGPSFSGDDLSFPSGHTITAFTFATFIAEYTKDKSRIIPVLAYSAAALAGWSRVHDGAHWGSDVIMGALVGHLVTKLILSKHSKKSGISISPYMSPEGGMMVGVSYTGKQFNGIDSDRGSESEEDNDSFLFNEF